MRRLTEMKWRIVGGRGGCRSAGRMCRVGVSGVMVLAVGLPGWGQDQPTLDELLDLAPPPSSPGDGGGAGGAGSGSGEAGAGTTAESAGGESGDGAGEGGGEGGVLTDEVRRQLEQQEAADAFAQAVADMSRVAGQLEAREPGIDTQRLQESILERLDQAIASAESQQSSSSSSSSGSSGSSSNQDNAGGNAQQPSPGQAGASPEGAGGGQPGQEGGAEASDGGFSPGQVGPVDPSAGGLEELRREWGNLPPRLRDELTNGMDEPFSPIYRELTERYYRRLAEEAEP